MKDFQELITTIEHVHGHLQASAANAVNQALTIRNWLIGHYIVEFEQGGKDRAEYGTNLISEIAKASSVEGLSPTNLKAFRQFYLTYPQIGPTLSGQSQLLLGHISQISQTLSDQLHLPKIWEATTSDANNRLQVPPEKIVTRLSFSHLVELIKIEEPLKRTFYELECIKGTWSVRELKRQISSLYFERSGLSEKPEKLSEMVHQKTAPLVPKDIIKNIYAFEFLGLSTKPILEESDLESALLDNLQAFIMELGHGFCLEARQKRILIGENYYFIDLVFYHRFLRCHILIELKLGAFDHNDIGQLNTYVNYYRMEIMQEHENPPVGILMVADKDHALVKYATAGMDENLFIQEYLIRLPSKDQLERYIESELRKVM